MTPLGAALRKIRGSLDMTLKEHAVLVGVTSAYFSALEHGHRGVPTDEMLRRIVAALDISREEAERIAALVHVSRPKVTIDTTALDPEATELANRLADNIAALPKSHLDELLWRLQDMLTHRNGL